MSDKNIYNMVSVVVPIYNTKPYIRKCVESILNQTYLNIELILVDDGSTDGSGDVCDEYAKRYEKIGVIHQENMGLLSARKTGVNAASGQYILFVDSDDYIENDLIDELMHGMLSEETDLVVSYLLYEDEGMIVKSDAYIQDGRYKKEKILGYLIDNEISGGTGMPVSMCGKLFVRDKLGKAFRRINKRLSYGEDLAELLFFIEEAEWITFISKWGYHYVKRNGSMSCSASVDYFREIKELYDYIETECKVNQSDPEILKQANYFIRYLLVETTQEVFPSVDIGFIPFVPPFEMIPRDCRLAVYGAGRVGKSMVKCLSQNHFVTLCGWFDQNAGRKIYSIEIEEPEKIQEAQFDYILIAVAIKDYMIQIKERLEKTGVPKEKIIWKKPYCG